MENGSDVLLLLSGGIDSTACLDLYLSDNRTVDALFIDYGQLSNDHEFLCALKIAKHYKIEINKIKIDLLNKYKDGEILGRNALLIFTALMHDQGKHHILSLGIHKGPDYYDCSHSFVNQINEIIINYSIGTIMLETPFLECEKKFIIEYCSKNKVPLHLTYSCENGYPPCNCCESCRDRKRYDVEERF